MDWFCYSAALRVNFKSDINAMNSSSTGAWAIRNAFQMIKIYYLGFEKNSLVTKFMVFWTQLVIFGPYPILKVPST